MPCCCVTLFHLDQFYLEALRVKDNQVAWTDYTKPKIEAYIADKFANFLGDQSQKAIELFENLYLDPGTKDDDNLAWFKFTVDVRNFNFFFRFYSKSDQPFCFHFLHNGAKVQSIFWFC